MPEPLSERDREFQLRPATVEDVPLIAALVRELAEFEKLSDAVTSTEDDFRVALFGPRPAAEVWIAETDGQCAGFMLFYPTFSTFVGRPGIYLEDVYVRPEYRRRGLGRKLLQKLAALAVERNCGRLEWSALKWNQNAIDFYIKVGAEPLEEWSVFRLSRDKLNRLAAGYEPPSM